MRHISVLLDNIFGSNEISFDVEKITKYRSIISTFFLLTSDPIRFKKSKFCFEFYIAISESYLLREHNTY